ncbi:unnamed protein product [Bursaphelenchus okinawaensis]|uniref:Uncharacterized protein n=1 Tax=Bursaphelenchus okinawaensis TaxID=465554 RepID=A0A811KQ29_9BILA|nr:unnamed protein product [Bursaphelenchus okinawaensis]CAG9108454.1 unnamed protein product [Bursaphelenchus okinawaensis]
MTCLYAFQIVLQSFYDTHANNQEARHETGVEPAANIDKVKRIVVTNEASNKTVAFNVDVNDFKPCGKIMILDNVPEEFKIDIKFDDGKESSITLKHSIEDILKTLKRDVAFPNTSLSLRFVTKTEILTPRKHNFKESGSQTDDTYHTNASCQTDSTSTTDKTSTTETFLNNVETQTDNEVFNEEKKKIFIEGGGPAFPTGLYKNFEKSSRTKKKQLISTDCQTENLNDKNDALLSDMESKLYEQNHVDEKSVTSSRSKRSSISKSIDQTEPSTASTSGPEDSDGTTVSESDTEDETSTEYSSSGSTVKTAKNSSDKSSTSSSIHTDINVDSGRSYLESVASSSSSESKHMSPTSAYLHKLRSNILKHRT